MRWSARLFVGLVLVLASGCLSTWHVEQQRQVYTGVDPSGAITHSDNTVRNERSWFGPWLGLPSQAIP